MDAGHILLGRSWEFDRAIVHDGWKNTYSFMFKNIKVTPLPTREQFPKRTQENEKFLYVPSTPHGWCTIQ